MNTAQSIANRIKLVTLTCGAWRATRLNKAESLEVNSKHGTEDSAKVIVRLTDHKALSDLYKLHAAAYTWHRANTLPSVQDGIRVVPAGKELDHAARLAGFAADHEKHVKAFLADYDDIRRQAPIKLNGLFDGNQWPDSETVEGKFSFAFRYLPCPVEGAWESWLNETVETGQAELRQRLVEAALHLATVCAGDGRIFQSALDNLHEVCEFAGEGFNLMDDPIIAQAAASLKPVANVDAELLRDDNARRKETASKVSTILATLKL